MVQRNIIIIIVIIIIRIIIIINNNISPHISRSLHWMVEHALRVQLQRLQQQCSALVQLRMSKPWPGSDPLDHVRLRADCMQSRVLRNRSRHSIIVAGVPGLCGWDVLNHHWGNIVIIMYVMRCWNI